MIISASRRTDIPAYYSEWFFNRIKAKEVFVRNPLNIHQISRIDLSPEVVDCIVFWTKNPNPMLKGLDQLNDYRYYFQFTLNSYDKDIEVNLPSKMELINTFKLLSEKIGKEKVIWRYDPIIINEKYTITYHEDSFNKISYALRDYTEKCTVSFIDLYSNIKENIKELGIKEIQNVEKREIAERLSRIAFSYGLKMDTCAEDIELNDLNISHARCIDDRLISRIIGSPIKVEKDKNQRLSCGCVASIDIGLYNTCQNGCKYCYANHNQKTVIHNYKQYDSKSPLLCSHIEDIDKISERRVESLKQNQISFEDYNTEVLKTLYPLLSDFIYHYISFKEINKCFNKLPGDRKFWLYTNDAHLKIATVTWCMIFGTEANRTHWKRLNLDNDNFRTYFFSKAGINKEVWKEYWKEINKFRNEFIAHRDGVFNMPVPIFDTAYKAVLILDLWIREKIAPDYIESPPYEEIAEKYRTEIKDTLWDMINKNT